MIQVERVGAVLTIVLDRPEVRNAMSGALCANVTEVLAANADARAIILTGSGSAFCAGADLASRFGAGDGQGGATDTFRPNFEIMLDAMNDHQAPVIAAINGAAIGAGMQLIVACDLRVARLRFRHMSTLPQTREDVLLRARALMVA